MPITKNVKKNFHELYADNAKSGKEKGANGKARSRKQIIAIALSKSKKGYDFKKAEKKLGVKQA
jgi:hypothetical protein